MIRLSRDFLVFLPGYSFVRFFFAGARRLRQRLSLFPKKVFIGYGCNLSDVAFEGFSKIYPRCSLSRTSIGRATYIASDGIFEACKIGRFCSIGPGVQAGLATHPLSFPSTHPAFYSSLRQSSVSFQEASLVDELPRPIDIGHDVWIGARATLLGGVTIGTGAVVAAGALVTKDVPPYAIVAGVPARIIRFRFACAEINRLMASEWWELSLRELEECKSFFSRPFCSDDWIA